MCIYIKVEADKVGLKIDNFNCANHSSWKLESRRNIDMLIKLLRYRFHLVSIKSYFLSVIGCSVFLLCNSRPDLGCP